MAEDLENECNYLIVNPASFLQRCDIGPTEKHIVVRCNLVVRHRWTPQLCLLCMTQNTLDKNQVLQYVLETNESCRMADHGDVPGNPPTITQKAVLSASSVLETFKPLSKICEHVCAFHLYAHDDTRQVLAHHYCTHLSSEVRQCLLYEGGQPGARLIGVEYMISSRLFEVRDAHSCGC